MTMFFNEAWAIWSQAGAAAVVDYLNGQEEQVETAETYHKLMKDLYWQEKNVPDMVVLARAGMDYGLSTADSCADSDPGMAYDLRSWAKSIAYDLASFTWRGWDEPGIELSAEDEALGLRAAELNLRLAVDLDKGALRISRAYWILGAQQMAAGRLADAEDSFRAGELQGAEAGAAGDELICRAFTALTAFLQHPADQAYKTKLAEAKSRVREGEHGAMYLEQVETAERILGY